MFANQIMLAGLGGAVVPLVIHLLNRARYRTVTWGAMMFLQPANLSQQHIGRLREFALLGVRMLLVALLAMALARPMVGRNAAGAVAESGRVTAAIIVDCSASMSHDDGGATRMSAARSAVLRVLSTLRRGDQVSLIAPGVPPAFTGDLQSLAARVSELKPTAASADSPASIAAALDALATQPPGGEKRIYLVCDQQASNWTNATPTVLTDLKRRLAGINFAVIPVGSTTLDNLSIDDVAIVNPPAVAGGSAMLHVTLRNHGPTERLGQPLALRLDERDEQSTTVNLTPMDAATVTLPVRFAAAGQHVVSVELGGASGDVDDRRDLIVDVSPPIPVLIVRDEASREPVDYLRAAFTPFASSGRAGGDVASVTIAAADDLDFDALDRYRVIIIDDAAGFDDDQARALQQFVYAGGGLVIAPGSVAQTNEYNRHLYREESALLPALLQPAVAPPQPQAIDPASIDIAHPIFRFLAEHPPALPGTFDRYFPVTGRTGAARVLATFVNGEPWIVESTFGAGRTVLFTSPLDGRWSSLPLTNLYLPLLQSAVRYASGGSGSGQNLLAGGLWTASIPASRAASRALVIRPDGSRDQAEVIDVGDRAEIRYRHTLLAGVYSVRLGPRAADQFARFAVAPAPVESDLRPLTEQRWNELSSALGFERSSGMPRMGMSAAVALAGGEIWLALLLAVIVLLVIEMSMTASWLRNWRGRFRRRARA